ncbi:MAG: hypothetical protein RBS40_07525 [Rhodocyclaceae bacterium]|jgi:voltage-gated potassium channel|nr:hypothetical protein [Rhodocyclaceae bacterium]
MLLGWGSLAVPTGIVSAEMTARRFQRTPTTRSCPDCLTAGHAPEARYCAHGGTRQPTLRRDPET